jgi:hypothetical protein
MVQLGDSCARLFSQPDCNTCFDDGFDVYPGDSDPNLKYGSSIWNRGLPTNGILSTVVNWGCKLTLFQKTDYQGNFRIYYNGVDASFGNFGTTSGGIWNNPVGSYRCECPSRASNAVPAQAVGEWITVVTGNSSTGISKSSDISAENGSFLDEEI